MKITLKEFQEEAVADLLRSFRAARGVAADRLQAVVLSAPTGSGKTVMATALIETLLAGNGDEPGDPNYTFLWVTDQPELNLQTRDKMAAVSSQLVPSRLVVIDASLADRERLVPGRVYFLNTQKLSATSSLARPGDDRTWTLWEILSRTITEDPTHFVVVIDEAHRGMQGKDADEAESIVQKFLKGSPGEIPPAPLVIGISATPERFQNMLKNTKRVSWAVDVDPQAVRASGLIKEAVDIYHPKGEQAADVTLLTQAVETWKQFTSAWGKCTATEGIESVRPILLVQVEDGQKGNVSKTDLNVVVSTLYKEIGPEPGAGWIGHAFQEGIDQSWAGHNVRYIAPSRIEADPEVQVVLFKTSLNTGWDCPRAETLVSFRTAKDETHIAQLVGRMVRAPLARRIDADESLNAVTLYLPYYNAKAVQKVKERLKSDPSLMPPTDFRDGAERVRLVRREGCEAIFEILAALPTYTVPRLHPQAPVDRLANLARLLADTGLAPEPVRTYRGALVQLLREEAERRKNDADFRNALEAAGTVEMGHVRVLYGTAPDPDDAGDSVRVRAADVNLEDRFEDAGRLLGQGLHREYVRRLRDAWLGEPSDFPMRDAKIEACALAAHPDVIANVNDKAKTLTAEWLRSYKAAFTGLGEKHRQALREIEGAAEEPTEANLVVPDTLDWHRGSTVWERHLFVEQEGGFREDFVQSAWEPQVLREELEDHPEVVAWLRLLDRKPWALCVPYKADGVWHGTYPDFLIFRRTPGGVIPEIVDPHLLGEEHAPQRAAGLAQYAERHGERFGRIDLVIVDEGIIRRLNLLDTGTRARVAAVTNHAHLRSLFEKG